MSSNLTLSATYVDVKRATKYCEGWRAANRRGLNAINPLTQQTSKKRKKQLSSVKHEIYGTKTDISAF